MTSVGGSGDAIGRRSGQRRRNHRMRTDFAIPDWLILLIGAWLIVTALALAAANRLEKRRRRDAAEEEPERPAGRELPLPDAPWSGGPGLPRPAPVVETLPPVPAVGWGNAAPPAPLPETPWSV